jgi:hypothetical protein
MSADDLAAAERKVKEFFRFKLPDRPFTERLLKLAGRPREQLGEAVERVRDSLEAEIDQAIVLVAVAIAMDAACEVFGVEWTTTAGPLPWKFYIAGVLAFVIVMSLSDQTKQEKHTAAQDVGFRVISSLLVLKKNEEVVSLFEKSHWQLLELLKKRDHPKVKEWLDSAMQLTVYYV